MVARRIGQELGSGDVTLAYVPVTAAERFEAINAPCGPGRRSLARPGMAGMSATGDCRLLARLRGLGRFWVSDLNGINGLAEKVFTTSGLLGEGLRM